MAGEHCIIGTFTDNLMCIPVEDVILNEENQKLDVKSTVTFINRNEYLQGRVLFVGGKLHLISIMLFCILCLFYQYNFIVGRGLQS